MKETLSIAHSLFYLPAHLFHKHCMQIHTPSGMCLFFEVLLMGIALTEQWHIMKCSEKNRQYYPICRGMKKFLGIIHLPEQCCIITWYTEESKRHYAQWVNMDHSITLLYQRIQKKFYHCFRFIACFSAIIFMWSGNIHHLQCLLRMIQVVKEYFVYSSQ